MHTGSIPRNSTIATVWSSLSARERYVSEVLGKMHLMRKLGEDLVVRIGITGTGKQPNYRIEDRREELASIAYDGATHKPFPDEEQLGATTTWSASEMRYMEVVEHRKAAAKV